MTDGAALARLYVMSVAAVLLVALWLLVARTPFPTAPARAKDLPVAVATATSGPAVDPRIAALERRERALQQRAARVVARRDARFAAYRSQLDIRRAANAAAAAATYAPVDARTPASVQVAPAAPATTPVTSSGSS